MNPSGPTATDIQSHLYNSFINGSTYDVVIRISGTWRAVYKLHRVVLIQSGFFSALFTAGFSESKYCRLRRDTDEITVSFDDFNITRPAFETCISRLYGGGPPLHISPSLLPTTDYPLTPPFSDIFELEEVPLGHQPAGHRFLLSLLATSIYLSIPSVASQTVSLILKTVGPTTVLDYLNFACGKCLVYVNPLPADSHPAVGLENVANILDDEEESCTYKQFTKSFEGLKSHPSTESNSEPLSPVNPEGASPNSEDGRFDDSILREPSYHYGTVSDKIGEACACWLARWATDILQLESKDFETADHGMYSQAVSSNSGIPAVHTSSGKRPKPPIIWGHGGLTAKWVAAIVSADTLFVKSERERYNLARTVVELRRRAGIFAEEELIWSDMFENGIYYTNMLFEDLLFISQDISPTTKRTYAPMSVLQAARWRQSVLRHHITSHPLSSPNGSPSRDKELGITFTTADILTKLTETDRGDAEWKERYHPVFTDQSLKIGDGGNNTSTPPSGTIVSMEDLFSPSHRPSPRHGRAITGPEQVPAGSINTSEKKFFGISTPQMLVQDCVSADNEGKTRWSPFPPYRFSVEFWDVDLLKEKSRLHSQTIWYAGSLFNVYVQLVRKKGQAQLGIYLHRQSHVDTIPASSVPPLITSSKDNALERHQFRHSLPSSLPISQSSYSSNHHSPSIYLIRSGTPANHRNESPSSPPSPSSSPPGASAYSFGPARSANTTLQLHQPYRDPRSSISAYFAISCASATGSSQTRFSSSPDTFSVSQSWGWKSSSLRTEEFLEVETQPLSNKVVRGKEVSLRATVVLGLV